jgi:ATP-dependent RNA helicase RhlE
MPFSALGLEPRLVTGVSQAGYTEPTPIQRDAIPHVLAGRDVCGCAQTGTGKTAAFVLPLLQRLSDRPGVKALVLTPTRELALQIHEVARDFGKSVGRRSVAVFGGVGYQPQIDALRRGVDMVVATPGRLVDLVERGNVTLSPVEILVLDEADRMLDMGFLPTIRHIMRLLPERRQNLLFSATMSSDVARIVNSTLTDPVSVEVAPSATTVDLVDQKLYPVAGVQKGELLVRLIEHHDLDRVLVFTRTKHRADRVCKTLTRAGVRAAAIHGDRSQSQRQAALDGFKRGSHRVLVATDVMGRGIDIDGVSHVINFDMPSNPDDYVHRIGRTARAGASGIAISFLSHEELPELRGIEARIGQRIDCEDLEGFTYADRVVPMAERPTTKPVKRLAYSSGVRRSMSPRGRGRR